VSIPLRVSAVCGLLTPVVYTTAMVLGGLAQPDAYSSLDDDISDLGALTASHAWIYNRIGTNLNGLLILLFAIGLWRALSPSVLGRIGAAALMVLGVGQFLEGFLRLDCRGIDEACTNTSWHADAHKIESSISAAAIFVAPIVLAFAFRRLPAWRRVWIPTLAAIPVSIAASVVASVWGDGAAIRASTLVWFLWLALAAAWLYRLAGEDDAVPG
jgi:hypothetical protein